MEKIDPLIFFETLMQKILFAMGDYGSESSSNTMKCSLGTGKADKVLKCKNDIQAYTSIYKQYLLTK